VDGKVDAQISALVARFFAHRNSEAPCRTHSIAINHSTAGAPPASARQTRASALPLNAPIVSCPGLGHRAALPNIIDLDQRLARGFANARHVHRIGPQRRPHGADQYLLRPARAERVISKLVTMR